MGVQARLVLGALVLSFLGASVSNAGTVVPQGARFYFSQRGQAFFKKHLDTVLLANQIDLSKNHWNQIQFILNEKRDADILSELKMRFGSYFYGFPVNPPKFEVQLNNPDLDVKFTTVGAEVDPAGPAAYGKKSGAVVLVHLVADRVSSQAPELRLLDLANKDLFGIMGANRVSMVKNSDDRPVKIEVPVLVDTNENGATMQVLRVQTNLQKTDFGLNFGQLLLPKISITINGKEYDFDPVAFEKDLRSRLPEMSDLIQNAVKKYFETGGKDLIQPAFDRIAKTLTIHFGIGIKDTAVILHPKEAQYRTDHLLGIVFDTELKDTKAKRESIPTRGTAEEPSFTGMDQDAYDVSLSVHPAALNGAIDRAWASGLLKDITIGKDDDGTPEKIRLPKTPIVTLMNQKSPDRATFHAWITYRVKGLGGILFKHPIPIEGDLTVKIEPNGQNELEIVFDQIDEKNLKVDTSATWFKPFRAKVDKMVRDKIAKFNADSRTKRTLLFTLPTLNELLGIKLKLDQAKSDGGNLVLFGDFDVKPE